MREVLLLLALLSGALAVQAQTEEKIQDVRTYPDYYFLKIDDVASSLNLLPAPPQPDDILFQYDVARYQWGKLQRNTPRGELAIRDADASASGVCAAFSEAFGYELTEQGTPELFKLVKKIVADAGDLSTREAKNHYKRPRPYMLFGESTSVPQDEEALSHNGSYPSGHTAEGWAVALVLAEINVANQDAILQRGYDYGTSRVIVGYHWQSDVDNARIVASAVVARLHADEGFIEQLVKAKAEFKTLVN
ncbi:MAG: phosphatase PAP2 family protein [Bacteroidaceae bacterium]|nr:phosphatase PAP2 family protein [Bacteroidaceae bacterium]